MVSVQRMQSTQRIGNKRKNARKQVRNKRNERSWRSGQNAMMEDVLRTLRAFHWMETTLNAVA